MRQVTAYEAYGIFGDYDGNAPDTHTICLVSSEDLAKQLCSKLNEDPRSYDVVFVDGFEYCKRFRYRPELTSSPERVLNTLEDAMAEFENDLYWDEEDAD